MVENGFVRIGGVGCGRVVIVSVLNVFFVVVIVDCTRRYRMRSCTFLRS